MLAARSVAFLCTLLVACGPTVAITSSGETDAESDASGEGGMDPTTVATSGEAPSDDSGRAEDTGEVAECGNGIVEGDEPCDDGPVGSSTCSPECTPRCTLAWERSMPSNPDGGQRFTHVDVGANGDIWTVEPAAVEPMKVSRHGHDGEVTWTTPYEGGDSFLYERIVVSPDGTSNLWGTRWGDGTTAMLLIEVGPDGDRVVERGFGDPIDGPQRGRDLVMLDETRRLVSGDRRLTTTDREAWFAILDAAGTATWERSYSGIGTDTHSMDQAGPVAHAPGRVAAIILEYLGPQHYEHHLVLYDTDLQDPIVDVVLPIDGTSALVHEPTDLVIDDDGDIFVLYAHQLATSPTSARWTLLRYGPDGTLLGSLDNEAVGQDSGTVALRMVRAPAGEIVVGGFAYVSPEFEPWFLVLEDESVLCSWVGSQLVAALHLAVDDAGQIVLAGQDWRDGSSRAWLARLYGA